MQRRPGCTAALLWQLHLELDCDELLGRSTDFAQEGEPAGVVVEVGERWRDGDFRQSLEILYLHYLVQLLEGTVGLASVGQRRD